MKRLLLAIATLLITSSAFAQNNHSVDLGKWMNKNPRGEWWKTPNTKSNEHEEQNVKPGNKSKKAFTLQDEFYSCKFATTTFNQAKDRLSSYQNVYVYSEQTLLMENVTFSGKQFDVGLFSFLDNRFCAIQFFARFDESKLAVACRDAVYKKMSSRYPLVREDVNGYKCYYSTDNRRVMTLTLEPSTDDYGNKFFVVCVSFYDAKYIQEHNS